MHIRPDSETDITRRFGRRILGSTPGRGTRNLDKCHAIMLRRRGYGSMVEHLVANQMMGVRFSLPAQQSARGFQTVRHQFQSATARVIHTQKRDECRTFVLIGERDDVVIQDKPIAQVFEQFTFLLSGAVLE